MVPCPCVGGTGKTQYILSQWDGRTLPDGAKPQEPGNLGTRVLNLAQYAINVYVLYKAECRGHSDCNTAGLPHHDAIAQSELCCMSCIFSGPDHHEITATTKRSRQWE